MNHKARIAGLLVAQLIAVSGYTAMRAIASPTGGSASATALEPNGGTSRTAVSVSWTLGSGESACGIYWNSTDGITPPRGEAGLSGQTTSWSGTIEEGTAGQTIYFRVASSTDGCFTLQPSDPIAVTIPAYVDTTATTTTAATPASAPAAAPSTTTDVPTTTTADCDLACLEARVATLEDEYAKLAARVDAIQQANDAAWQTYAARVADGWSDENAALAARSAGMNAIYALDAPAP